jgi:hypothetical protein
MPFKPHLLRSSGFFSTTGTAPSHLPPPSGNFTSPGHPELRANVSDSLDSNRGTVLDVDGSFAFVEDMPFLPLGAVVLFERSGVHGTERPRTIPQHALLAAFFFHPCSICVSRFAGLVMKISKEFIMIGVLGPTSAIMSGDVVSLFGNILTFPTGPSLEGTPFLTAVSLHEPPKFVLLEVPKLSAS